MPFAGVNGITLDVPTQALPLRATRAGRRSRGRQPTEYAVKKALMVWGGWDGHTPKESIDRFVPFLKKNGFEVVVKDTLEAYADKSLMSGVNLIVQCWTMGTLSAEAGAGLNDAVRAGVGLAGWHGGLCDSFRGNIDYQWMTGGQFLGHPGNIMDYEVHIENWDDPVTAGIKDFKIKTEQYYMMVDPSNLVLATAVFDGVHDPLRKGVAMPTVWKRR